MACTLDASGATEPGLSLKRQAEEQPWSTCRRPWSLMYFTAHGRALPCCIAPFSARGYATYTLGDATQQTPARDLERPRISGVPRRPAQRCAAEALRELRAAMEPVAVAATRREPVAAVPTPTEPVAVIIPTLNEAAAIGAVIAELPRAIARQIIVADSGSRDGTPAVATRAGAQVVSLAQRGYGRACAAAAAAADPACTVLVFLDGDGADRGDLLETLVGRSWTAHRISSSPRARAGCVSLAR